MDLVSLKQLSHVTGGNLDTQRHRAIQFLRKLPRERRIGWPSNSSPKTGVATPEHVEMTEILKEIQDFAGVSFAKRDTECVICKRNKLMFTEISQRDYVFICLPKGFVYRWEYSLTHYLEGHKIAPPKWMPELIQDFNEARKLGLWSSLHGGLTKRPGDGLQTRIGQFNSDNHLHKNDKAG